MDALERLVSTRRRRTALPPAPKPPACRPKMIGNKMDQKRANRLRNRRELRFGIRPGTDMDRDRKDCQSSINPGYVLVTRIVVGSDAFYLEFPWRI